MSIADDPMPNQPEKHDGDPALLQIQQQFQQLTGQFDRLRQQIGDIYAESSQGSRQLAVLIEHLTNPKRTTPLLEQVAEMATNLDAAQTQIEELTHRTARQEQLERLVEVVAGQSQLEELNENLKKLTRTQFKSNTLVESKSGQVEQALSTLRTLATQREAIQEERTERFNQQITDAHRAGRAEFAAELIPALDSIDLALTNGAKMLTRQRERVEQLQQREQTTLAPAYVSTERTSQPGFWQRLFGSSQPSAPPPSPTVASSSTPLVHDIATATEQAVSAWLQGLELVGERFTLLLAGEDIYPIDALHQPFDPNLHVAVETTICNDIEPNTVIRVVRQGYRHNGRVLRYAEVVVAHQAES